MNSIFTSIQTYKLFPNIHPFISLKELRMGYVLFVQVNDYEILGIMRW